MNPLLHQNTVLVLNRNWQAIGTKTPAEAFCMQATDTATGLDIDGQSMVPVKWVDWIKLPIRAGDNAVHTSSQAIRIPTVIVLARYNRVPKKVPKFSAAALWERDDATCQYTGKRLRRGEGNIDHVVPRSRGGVTDWHNCVLADRTINTRKGSRLPDEAGLQLLRPPTKPKALPITLTLRNLHGIPDWDHFLMKT